jgi:hypothetical protein
VTDGSMPVGGEGDGSPVSHLMDLMDEVGSKVFSWLPPVQRGLSFGEQTVAALYFGCVGFYRGILILLREGLTPEAETLARTLMYDTATLVYLRGQHKRLEELAMRFVYSSMRHEMRLYSEMKMQGWPQADQNMSIASKEMSTLRREAKKLGTGPLERFLSPDELLEEMRQTQGRVLIERAHLAVHTSRVSLGSRVRRESQEKWGFTYRGPDQDVLRLGAPAVDLFLAASEATAGLLRWKSAWRISKLRQDTVHELSKLLRQDRPS